MMQIEDVNKMLDEQIAEEENVVSDNVTSVIKIGDKSKSNKLNKFDVFFIRVWAFICAFIFKLTSWICKGLGFVLKKEIPKKYVTAVIATILIIIAIALVSSPFSVNVTKIETLDLYPNKLIAVQKHTGMDSNGDPVYKWGFADKNGGIKLDCKYDEVLDFKYGVAFVKCVEQRNGAKYSYWMLIDTKGRREGNIDIVQNGDQVPVQQFSSDTKLARIQLANKYGYMDTKGRIKIEALFDDAGSFNEGIARVVNGSQVYFINKKGKQVSETYTDARDMIEGRAAVETVSGKWGFIDKKGQLVIKSEWDAVSNFYNGYAAVKRGTTYGIIDASGNTVVKSGLFHSLNILEYFN